MPIQATPYSLVYGVEVVLPFERQIPLLRITIHEGLKCQVTYSRIGSIKRKAT